jgi:hypothetical protein
MRLSYRTHYNPCFWTAYWNPSYYAAAVGGSAHALSARSQTAFALSVKADKIFETTVEHVHVDKDVAPAMITFADMKEFVRRNHPSTFETFCAETDPNEFPYRLNLESMFRHFEGLSPYVCLRDVIANGRPRSLEEKANIACFVILQGIRSHAIMHSLLEMTGRSGRPRFEYFIHLKWSLGETDFLDRTAGRLALARWVLYRTRDDTFPLSDSAVLTKPGSIMVALSPRLLLEIFPWVPSNNDPWELRNTIKPGKLAEFRKRTIGNTFREIIFGQQCTLEYWRETKEFRGRVLLLQGHQEYNVRVAADHESETWLINAFANQ